MLYSLEAAFRDISRLCQWPEMLVRADGTILVANQPAAEISGKKAISLEGRGLPEIFADSPEKIAECLRLWSTSTRVVPVRLSWSRPAGSPLPMLLEGGQLHPRAHGTRPLLLVRRSFKEDSPRTEESFRTQDQPLADKKRSNDAVAFLAHAGKALSCSLDPHAIPDTLANLVVPELADWCVIHVLPAKGNLEVVKAAHADQKREQALREIENYWAARPGSADPVSVALQTGQPQLLKQVTLDDLRTFASCDEEFELRKCLGVTSLIVTLIAVRRQTLGTLTMASTVSHLHYDERDLELARNLAELAGLALDNARLFEQTAKAVRDRDCFLATLGHELRNPLGAISNSINLMELRGAEDVRSKPQLAPQLANVRRQVKHLSRLVDDLLDVTRVAKGKVSLKTEAVDLASVAQICLDSAESQIQGADMNVSMRLAPGRVAVGADPARLEQVVCNLLCNALKYTPAGGSIEIEVARQEQDGIMSVRDNGFGIATEMLDRVFEPFWQADSSVERSRGGLGLGLTLAKGLVEAMGGSIEAHSEGLGKGSEFVIRLPLFEGPAAEEREIEQPVRPGLKILVIEDNKDISEPLCDFLAHVGFHVQSAVDGQTGLKNVFDELPDVILIDIGLPRMSGYEVARKLRESPGGKCFRLVAMTGYSQPEDRARAHAAGFDAYLVKPVEMDSLLSTIRRLSTHEYSQAAPSLQGSR